MYKKELLILVIILSQSTNASEKKAAKAPDSKKNVKTVMRTEFSYEVLPDGNYKKIIKTSIKDVQCIARSEIIWDPEKEFVQSTKLTFDDESLKSDSTRLVIRNILLQAHMSDIHAHTLEFLKEIQSVANRSWCCFRPRNLRNVYMNFWGTLLGQKN